MSRITQVKFETSEGKAKELLSAVKKQMGGLPNIFLSMANAPAALEGFLNFNSALGQGVLSPAMREQIALATAGQNHCDYCASAHTALGKGAGIEEEELQRNLNANSKDKRTDAVLAFAKKLVETRGEVSDGDISSLRKLRVSDEEIIEIIAHVAANTFTNYFNNVVGTEIDFPRVSTSHIEKAA